METSMELPDMVKKALTVLLLLILPWIILVAGLAISLINVWFLLLVTFWIGAGIIFYTIVPQGD